MAKVLWAVVLPWLWCFAVANSELWWSSRGEYQEPEKTFEKLQTFFSKNFEGDKAQRAISSFSSLQSFKCNDGTEVLIFAPPNYMPDTAKRFKMAGAPKCGDQLQWSQLAIHESVWMDGSGRVASCSFHGFEAGGGIAEETWPVFPTAVNETIALKEGNGMAVYVDEVVGLVQHFSVSSHRALTELLPKYLQLFEMLKRRKDTKIAIPRSDLMLSILLQLGEPRSRIVELRPGQWIRAGRALFVSPVINGEGENGPELMDVDQRCFDKTMHNLFKALYVKSDYHDKEPPMDRIVIMTRIFRNEFRPNECNPSTCLENGSALYHEIEKRYGKKYPVVEIWPQDKRLERLTNEIGRAKVLLTLNGISVGYSLMMQPGSTIIDLNHGMPRTFFHKSAGRRRIRVQSVVTGFQPPGAKGLTVDVEQVMGVLKDVAG